jgi:hypothetical protein
MQQPDAEPDEVGRGPGEEPSQGDGKAEG